MPIIASLHRPGSAATVADKQLRSYKAEIAFNFESLADQQFLHSKGFHNFEDFWRLPHHFVDSINYRRGGWSAVSRLEIAEGAQTRVFYVKRQENQFRYSVQHPLGALTFIHEVEAIKRNQACSLAAPELSCWGSRKQERGSQGLLVTSAITFTSLADLIAANPDWSLMLTVLRHCSGEILKMHRLGIQHGALYPNHIFINTGSGEIKFIDFERSRKRSRPRFAVRADLTQLVRRLDKIPEIARQALLQAYQKDYGDLVKHLSGLYPAAALSIARAH